MTYNKTIWVNGETPLNAYNLNHIENGIEGAKNTITLIGTSLINANGRVSFTLPDDTWICILTFGNTFILLPTYQLQPNTLYKTCGTFIYSSGGDATTTTINYTLNSNNILEIWSGNNQFSFVSNYTTYLFKIGGN